MPCRLIPRAIAWSALLSLSLAADHLQAAPNIVTLRNQSGVAITDYPVQIGRPFVEGEIANYPQIGQCSDSTCSSVAWLDAAHFQSDVKCRWSDSSVKHAIISFIVASLPTGNTFFTFRNAASGNNTPISQSDMLAPGYDYDAILQATFTAPITGVTIHTGAAGSGYSLYDLVNVVQSGAILGTVKLNTFSGSVPTGIELGGEGIGYSVGSGLSTTGGTGSGLELDITSVGSTTTSTISARAMIAAQMGTIPDCEAVNWGSVTNTTMCYWLKGPINTTVVVADNSVTASGDFGADVNKSLRPSFIVAFWPTLSATNTRFVVDNANTQALQEQDYSVSLSIGDSSPSVVYTNSGVTDYPCTRWTKKNYWHGIVAPSSLVDIDSNLSYLISTYALPNFDTTKAPSESALSTMYGHWTSSLDGIYEQGYFAYKAMGTAGGRPELGDYPTWAVLWFYTGDHRMAEMTNGMADLAGAWAMYFRESKAAKAHFGQPVNSQDRPTLFININGQELGVYTTAAADKITPLLTITSGGWANSATHLYEMNYPSYLLTGDYFYFESMWFWNSWASFYSNPGSTSWIGRGPSGSDGAIHTLEPRGDAWVLARRVEFAWIMPDEYSAVKTYWSSLITDALACMEGERQVSGTPLDENAVKVWANNSFNGTWTAANSIFEGLGVPTLHFWEFNSGECQSPCNPSVSSAGTSPWMELHVAYALTRAAELGWPAQAMQNWVGVQLNGMVDNSSAISPYIIGNYRIPTASKTPVTWYDTWSAAAAGLDSTNLETGFYEWAYYPDYGYLYIAQSGLAGLTAQDGGRAWAWLMSLLSSSQVTPSDQLAYNNDPKWALLPRPLISRGTFRHEPIRFQPGGRDKGQAEPHCPNRSLTAADVQDLINKALAQRACTSTSATPCTIIDVQAAINSITDYRCR